MIASYESVMEHMEHMNIDRNHQKYLFEYIEAMSTSGEFFASIEEGDGKSVDIATNVMFSRYSYSVWLPTWIAMSDRDRYLTLKYAVDSVLRVRAWLTKHERMVAVSAGDPVD